MNKKNLPIGFQYFPELIRRGFLYVDKTELIVSLIEEFYGTFLSRPRRFGKSLTVTTLESIFLGKKELFKGTWIANSHYSWDTHPVIRLDGTKWNGTTDEKLVHTMTNSFIEIAEKYGIDLKVDTEPEETFSRLIRALRKKQGPVAVLIDEYDHPIVSQLENPERIKPTIDLLGNVYRILKSESASIFSVFVTGVSKFAKVSLFSGMNNLEDISLNPRYNALVGISEAEIDRYYLPYCQDIANKQKIPLEELRAKLKNWYNGYRFARTKEAQQTVYNPVSLHSFLKREEFANYWFATATPTFAIKLIKQLNYPIPDLEEGVVIGMELEERHETEQVDLIPLLYQTGYLTISNYDEEQRKYHLVFPNLEVKDSFLNHLFRSYTHAEEGILDPHYEKLVQALRENQIREFIQSFNVILSHIPYPMHVEQEAYYQSILFIILRMIGIRTSAEVTTYRGRLDLLIKFKKFTYVIECKINSSAKKALDQIKSRHYHAHLDHPVTLIGLNFDTKLKQITDYLEQSSS